jgi:capsular exopolysaccharide synthesis family protein
MSKFFKALKQAEEDRAREERESTSPPVLTTKEAMPFRPASRTETAVATATIDRPAPAVTQAVPTVVAPPSPKPSVERPIEAGEVEAHLVSLLAPASIEAEQYRTLRTLLEAKRREKGPLVIAVSSPGVGDGKTTTAINLAGSFAEGEDSRVLLLDADLRNPSVAPRLGFARSRSGLAAALRGRSPNLDGLITRRPPYRLDLVLAGESTAAPYELLTSKAFAELLHEARRSYDLVIIDAPPIVSLPDCRMLGSLVDGFMIVVAANRTPRRLLAEALNALDPEMVLGLVFNNDEDVISRYATYYGYHVAHGGKRSRVGKRNDGR